MTERFLWRWGGFSWFWNGFSGAGTVSLALLRFLVVLERFLGVPERFLCRSDGFSGDEKFTKAGTASSGVVKVSQAIAVSGIVKISIAETVSAAGPASRDITFSTTESVSEVATIVL